jgi:hypothetical protein
MNEEDPKPGSLDAGCQSVYQAPLEPFPCYIHTPPCQSSELFRCLAVIEGYEGMVRTRLGCSEVPASVEIILNHIGGSYHLGGSVQLTIQAIEHCIARSAHTSSLWRRGDWMCLDLDSKRQEVVHHWGDHLHVGALNVLPRNSTQMRQKTVGSNFLETYTILVTPSLLVSTLGGNRKSENVKMLGGNSRPMMSGRLDIGLNRPESISSWV